MRLSRKLLKLMKSHKTEFKIGPLQEAWLQTLESGMFLQTKHVLCELKDSGDYSFCCLGIAREVLEENEYCPTTPWDQGTLTTGDVNKLGLNGHSGELLRYHEVPGLFEALDVGHPSRMYLAYLNDSYDYSFEQIARFIRAFPEVVFTKSV